ncbi:hypothetical protein JW921_02980 [Candidatus Fermentibacterales bacterium]|nr:hypothetical protein [Candidatus Fermentibacterales bacterium]
MKGLRTTALLTQLLGFAAVVLGMDSLGWSVTAMRDQAGVALMVIGFMLLAMGVVIMLLNALHKAITDLRDVVEVFREDLMRLKR